MYVIYFTFSFIILFKIFLTSIKEPLFTKLLIVEFYLYFWFGPYLTCSSLNPGSVLSFHFWWGLDDQMENQGLNLSVSAMCKESVMPTVLSLRPRVLTFRHTSSSTDQCSRHCFYHHVSFSHQCLHIVFPLSIPDCNLDGHISKFRCCSLYLLFSVLLTVWFEYL